MASAENAINIVQIQTALLVPITTQFIEHKLNVSPNAELQVRRAVFWNAEDYHKICDALIAHIQRCRSIDPTKLPGDRPESLGKKKDTPPANASAPAVQPLTQPAVGTAPAAVFNFNPTPPAAAPAEQPAAPPPAIHKFF